MPKCTNKKLDFGRVGRRVVELDIDGGDLSSEAGMLLLRRMDQRLDLCTAAARALVDERQRGPVFFSEAWTTDRTAEPEISVSGSAACGSGDCALARSSCPRNAAYSGTAIEAAA